MTNNVDIDVRVRGDTSGVRKVERDLGRVSDSAKRTRRSFDLLGSAIAAVGGVAAIRSLSLFTDGVVELETRLRNVTSSGEEYNKVFADLFKVAQETGDSINGLADGYVRLSVSLPDALKETTDLVSVTELLSRGFAASGASAQTASGALLQLSQGIATNFQAAGQELNSFIEGAPAIAREVARQLGGEAAVDLKRFAQEGVLTAESFILALEASRDAIEAFAIPDTIGRSIQRIKNAFVEVAIESESLKGLVSGVADTFDFLAQNIDTVIEAAKTFISLALPIVIGKIVIAVKALTVAVAANPLGLLVTGISAAIVVFNNFDNILQNITKSLVFVIDKTLEAANALSRLAGGGDIFKPKVDARFAETGASAASANAAALFEAQTSGSGGSRSSNAASELQALLASQTGGKATDSKSGRKKKTQIDFQNEAIEAIKREREELMRLQDAKALGASQVDMVTQRIRAENEARRQGVDINTQAGKQIVEDIIQNEKLATQVERVNEGLRDTNNFMGKLREMVEATQNGFDDFGVKAAEIFGPGGTLSVGIGDAISQALIFGESFGESIRNVARTILSSLISALAQVGINMLLNATLGKTLMASSTAASAAAAGTTAAAWAPAAAAASLASFGANAVPAAAGLTSTFALSKVLSSVTGFKDGGFTGNVGTSDVAGVVHGQEFVVNAAATRNNRQMLEAMNAGKSVTAVGTGGGTNVYNIDARGADMGVVSRIEQSLREMDRNFNRRAVGAVSNARQRDPSVLGRR